MKEITKKCNTKSFEKILSEEKRFEIRLGDFEGESGDMLILKEYDNGKETGRIIKRKIGSIAKTKEMNYWKQEDIDLHGYTIIQLEKI